MVTRKEDPDEAADAFLDCGVKHAVIKLGKQGCLIKSRSERIIVPAVPDAVCLDTTGAGDNFAAGFLYGLIKNSRCTNAAALRTRLRHAASPGWAPPHGLNNIENRLAT